MDKTDFICVTNSRLGIPDQKLIAMTRPRRFGKSVTADMLCAYYSKGYAGREIFQGLNISRKKETGNPNQETCAAPGVGDQNSLSDDSYLEYLNKFDVIRIDMNTIKGRYEDYLTKNQKVEGVATLVDFLQYEIVSDLRKHSGFSSILGEQQIENRELFGSLCALHESLKISFVFIMDEWDLLYREYMNDNQLQQQFIDLLHVHVFKPA